MLRVIGCFRVILAVLFGAGAFVAGMNIVVWTAVGDDAAPLLQFADQLIQTVLRVAPNSIPSTVATLFILLLFAATILYFASGLLLLKGMSIVSLTIIRIQAFILLAAVAYSLLIYLLHGLPGPEFPAGFLFSLLPILIVLLVAVESYFLWQHYRDGTASNQET